MQRCDVRILMFGFGLVLCGGGDAALAKAPKVAASIAPLEMIAAAVMGDMGMPALLIPPNQSPHHGALKPSQARALAEADVVLWIGPDLEAGIDKALDARSAAWVAAHALTALTLPEVTRRSFRHLDEIKGEAVAHDHDGDKVAGESEYHHHGNIDPHLWLDPDNAVAIAKALAERLAALDAAHAVDYRGNADCFAASLEILKSDLAQSLDGVRGKGFVVFHDAYQYFEVRFGLSAVAALTLDPSRPIGGRHLREVQGKVRGAGAVCVFADAQAPKSAVVGLARDLGIKAGTLDPFGVGLGAKPESYAVLLRRLADGYRACLGD